MKERRQKHGLDAASFGNSHCLIRKKRRRLVSACRLRLSLGAALIGDGMFERSVPDRHQATRWSASRVPLGRGMNTSRTRDKCWTKGERIFYPSVRMVEGLSQN